MNTRFQVPETKTQDGWTVIDTASNREVVTTHPSRSKAREDARVRNGAPASVGTAPMSAHTYALPAFLA